MRRVVRLSGFISLIVGVFGGVGVMWFWSFVRDGEREYNGMGVLTYRVFTNPQFVLYIQFVPCILNR